MRENRVRTAADSEIVKEVLIELSATTADLVKSATTAISWMVLRSRLSAAIVDAGETERIAEKLRALASAERLDRNQARSFSEPQGEAMRRETARP